MRWYGILKEGAPAASVLPHIVRYLITQVIAHFCVLDRVGYFLFFVILFPSTEKAQNNVDD